MVVTSEAPARSDFCFSKSRLNKKVLSLDFNRELKGSMTEPNILIYFFFSTHHSIVFCFWCSVYWWKEVSDFSVLKYYLLNSVNILNECLRILIDCSQLSKTYYVLFGSFTRDRHAQRIYICGRLRWTNITHKASDAAEYMELFSSFTRDCHARQHIYRWTLRK